MKAAGAAAQLESSEEEPSEEKAGEAAEMAVDRDGSRCTRDGSRGTRNGSRGTKDAYGSKGRASG